MGLIKPMSFFLQNLFECPIWHKLLTFRSIGKFDQSISLRRLLQILYLTHMAFFVDIFRPSVPV